MKPKTLLYVEDSDVDVFFVKRLFELWGAPDNLRVVHTGENAVDYLAGANRFEDRENFPLPAMVLLDLKLPGMHGFDVLSWIRRQPQFEKLPVILFTASNLDADIRRAVELGATDYIVKPADLSTLPEILAPVLKRYLCLDAHRKQAA
ncbi:MAG: response regulator [Verrucomicrobia bacterium]|nr:response regulator [Verrucomicrobiota bacterium]